MGHYIQGCLGNSCDKCRSSISDVKFKTLIIPSGLYCDIICLEAIVLSGGKTMERLYDNRKKFTSFLLTGPVLINELLQY